MSKTSVSCCRYIYRRKYANKLAAAFLSFNTIWHSWLPWKLCSWIRRWARLKPDPSHTPHFSCFHLNILGVRVQVGATVNHLSACIPCQHTNYPSQGLRFGPGPAVFTEMLLSLVRLQHTQLQFWCLCPGRENLLILAFERLFAKQCDQHQQHWAESVNSTPSWAANLLTAATNSSIYLEDILPPICLEYELNRWPALIYCTL